MVSFKGHREGSIYLEESSRRRWDEESRSKEREEPATKKAKQNDDEESSYNDSIDDDDDNSDVSDELECFQFFYFHIMFVPQQPNDDTQQENKPIGFIRAEIIDRSRIRNGYFSEYMDAHSGEMQWLTAVLFDEGGRTQLPALALYDAYGPSFLVISQLSIVDAAFYADREDIETIAIHQLLNHPEIKQEHPITSAYCLLYDFDLYELKQRTPNFENQKPCPHRLRKNADAYLRNGFFQDPRAPLSHEDVLHKELHFGRTSVKQSLNRPRLEYNDRTNDSDSSDDDVGDEEESYRVDARDNHLCNWEDICDRTAMNILAHVNPKTMDELRQLKGVMDESMIETYGERVLETLREDS